MKLAMSQTAMSGSIQENLDKTLRAIRRAGEETLICLFNFSGAPQHVSLDAMEGICTDLITGEETFCAVKDLAPYQYALCRKRPEAE